MRETKGLTDGKMTTHKRYEIEEEDSSQETDTGNRGGKMKYLL